MSWPQTKLKDVANIVTGSTPQKKEGNYGGKVPFVTPGDLGNVAHISSSKITLTEQGANSSRLLPKNAVMVCCIGATIGKTGIADTKLVTNQQINSLIFDEKRVFPKYGYYYCSTLAGFLRNLSTSTTMPIVNKSSFSEIEIPLPPLQEQKRIAAILDKADAIRRKRQQAIQLADEFLRAVFLDMFGDPVSNPKGFKKAPITELADVITGFAFKSKEYVSDSTESVRLCRGANTLTGYFDWSDTEYWPKNRLEKLEGYLIKGGDIILAMDRPWISSGLKVCVFPENQRETYLVQRVARLRPHRAFYTDYIYSCVKSKAFESHCCPTETTVPHISPIELRNFEVLLPSTELIDAYHAIVSKSNRNMDRMVIGQLNGESLFSALSQCAFSGNI